MSETKKIDKQNVEDILPLAPVQEGMLFHYLQEPESELYFEQMSFRLTGDIQMPLVIKAWAFVIKSNEMLRAIFRWDELEKPIQVILKNIEPPCQFYDLTGLDPARQDAALMDIKKKDRRKKFDIREETFRVSLCLLASRSLEMVVSSYHIIYDGWSNGIILKEFLQAYQAYAQGREPAVSGKNKYREYIKWCGSRDDGLQAEYWRDYLAGFDTKTLLPADRKKQRPATTAADYTVSFTPELTAGIRDFARRKNITLAAFWYGLWGIVLQKYNDTSDVLFGTTVSGRIPQIKGIEEMVGLFINTPPFRVKRESGETANDLFNRLENSLRARDEYENTPLTAIKPHAAIDQKLELFDSIVVIENYPLDKTLSDSILKVRLSSIFEMTNYDLTLVISTFDNIGFRFIYDPQIYEAETIRRLYGQLAQAATLALAEPQAPIDQWDIIPAEEKKQLVEAFNRTQKEYPRAETIHSLIERQAAKTPDRIALSFDGQTLTYGQLNGKANQWAAYLRQKGVAAETVVGVMLERSLEMVVSIIAILKAGGAYLPIDTYLPEERVLYMLEDAGAKAVIINAALLDKIPFTALQGFLSRKRSSVSITNPRGHIEDFDGLPRPDRSLIDLTKYKGKIGMASVNHCISLQTTRGCPYQCLYCHKIWSKHHVQRSAENIYGEIAYYYQNGVRNFAVIDDCFNLDMESSSGLFRMIIQNKLKLQLFFPNGLRGDILTPDYIDLMVEAGARGINLSLETASPRLQKLLMKNLNLEKFKNVVDYIAVRHPEVILEMATMHGFPTETEEEAMMTLDFIKSVKWLHFPYIHILKIFPNTEMEDFALRHGVAKADILKSRDRAFHELPETLPFPKSFTRKYQADFMNEYFLSKERLKKVLPVQMRILDETALAQKYNAYLPVEIRSAADVVDFAEIDDFVWPEDAQHTEEAYTLFDRKPEARGTPPRAKKILFLDLSQHFSSHQMLYKVSEQPLGCLYLLTYLKKHFGAKIDGRIYKAGIDFDNFPELKELAEAYQPDLVCIRTLTYFKEFFHETVSLLRQWGITAPVFTGGPYASSDYETILLDKNVDLVVRGEGELTLTELLEKMLAGDFTLPPPEILQNIDGIAFRENKEDDDLVREVFVLEHMEDAIAAQAQDNLIPLTGADNLAYIMYTAGSTGRPKGVMVEHRQVNNCIFWMQDEFALQERNTVLQRTNLTFDPSVWEIFWPLYVGAQVKLITSEQSRDAEFLLRLMRDDTGLTLMYCPSSLLTAMVYLLQNRPERARLKLPWLLIGAEPVSRETVRAFLRHFEGKLVNTYGPTECTINNSFEYLHPDDTGLTVPIGKPVANNQFYILSKTMQIMPINAAGEICIAGDSVARGYINNPVKTAAAFVDNPFGPGKLYKTGDVGRRLADGRIEIIGRVDEQIKLRGYRIEPGEIAAVLGNHPAVKDCAVVVRDAARKFRETQTCKKCGITSAYPGISFSEDNICEICRQYDLYRSYMEKYFRNLEDLDEVIRGCNQRKKSEYDCLLLYSGGRGAAYALYQLAARGYRILAATYDNGYFSKADLENIRRITQKAGADHIVLTHPNAEQIFKASLDLAQTVCRGCFHTSSSLAGEYAYKNGINLVIGATLSRGQILENKLFLFYRQGIAEVKEIEKELANLQRSAAEMDQEIFARMDIDAVKDKTVYDAVKFVDFYRYCDVTNAEMLEFLNRQDQYWQTRKNYAIYSTNCPIKQIGDFYHLQERGYHYYGGATFWEKRLGHLTDQNVQEDLSCRVPARAWETFARRIGYQAQTGKQLNTKYICAYYAAEGEVSPNGLRAHLSARLPDYMLPSHFVAVENIPYTPNGKLDREALPEPEKTAVAGAAYEAPENEAEENVAEVWQKVLGLDRIGRQDNFFDLGGNSILLIQMHAQLEKKYPGKTTMTDLFAYTTVAKLAEFINGKSRKPALQKTWRGFNMPDDYFAAQNENNAGVVFQFRLEDDVWDKLQAVAGEEKMPVSYIVLSILVYLFKELSGEEVIRVHTAVENLNETFAMEIDLRQISDFKVLWQTIRHDFQHKDEESVYALNDADGLRQTKQAREILPLFYRRECLAGKINSREVFDFILEMAEEENGCGFVCDYNIKRLRRDKVKGIVDGFSQLMRMLTDEYKLSGEEVAI
ncbi:MAG: condensation domain-containing protein [Bacillota bacterium]